MDRIFSSSSSTSMGNAQRSSPASTTFKVVAGILAAFGAIYAGIETGFFAGAIHLIVTNAALQYTLIAMSVVVSLAAISYFFRSHFSKDHNNSISKTIVSEKLPIIAENAAINATVQMLDSGQFSRVQGCERRAPKPLYNQSDLIGSADLGSNLRSIFSKISPKDLSVNYQNNLLNYLEGRLQLYLEADGFQEAYNEIKILFSIMAKQMITQDMLKTKKEQMLASLNTLGSMMDTGTCVTIVLTQVETEYRKFKGDYAVDVYCDSIVSEVKSQILLSYKQDGVILDGHGLNTLKKALAKDLGFNTKYAQLDHTREGITWDPISAKTHFYTIWQSISLIDCLRNNSDAIGFQILFDLVKMALQSRNVPISIEDNVDILDLFFENKMVNGRFISALNERGAKLLLLQAGYISLAMQDC